MLVAFLICIAFLISATSIGFLMLNRLEVKQEKELKQEELRLDSGNFKRKNLLVKQKLLRLDIFLREMELDFALIFPTIDCNAKTSQDDFCNKYQPLWAKVSEVQMIADFYAPSIRKLAEELDELTISYWKHLHKVLVIEESIDLSSLDYLEAEKYSQIIPTKINDIAIAKIIRTLNARRIPLHLANTQMKIETCECGF